MTDARPSRRSLLAVAAGTISSLAGCAFDEPSTNSDSDTTESSRSSRTSETPGEIGNGQASTPGDDDPPTIGPISVRVDDPQTVSQREFTVTIGTKELTEVVRLEIVIGNRVIAWKMVEPGTDEVELIGSVPGGQEYRIEVKATDDTGNETSSVQTLRYVAPPTTAVDTDRLIGIHYYSWWGSGWHWNKGYDGSPVLGEYNSREADVIAQHLEWLQAAGINWLSLSWFGRDSWSGRTIRDHLVPSEGMDEFAFSILYETQSQLEQRANGWMTDFDLETNRKQFIADIEHLDDEYFSRDNYLHIDGRPVFYPYVSSGFIGDFADVRQDAEARIGQELYVLGDFPFQKWPPSKALKLDEFDGVANYSGFYQPWENINELVPEQAKQQYTEWLLRCHESDLDFIPTLSPGFDKTSHYKESSKELPILHGSPKKFSSWVEETRGLMDQGPNAVLLTSFNEWHEGTQFEPGEKHGTAYLDVVDRRLNTDEFLHTNLDAVAKVILEPDRTVAEHLVNPDVPEDTSRELAFTISSIELRNRSTGWVESFRIEPSLDHLYFIKGVFGYNEDWGRRWCGGVDREVIFGVPWETMRRATELVVTCAPQNELGDINVTGGLMDGERETRTITSGKLREYTFPIDM